MIDYNKVLFIDKYLYEQNTGVAKKRFVFSRLKSFIFSRPNFAKNTKVQGAFFKSMNRPDYDHFFRQVMKAAQFSGIRVEQAMQTGSLPQWRYAMGLLQYLPLFFSFRAESWKQRLFLYFCLSYYVNIANQFMRGPGYSYIVVFADMQPLDNLLCQMAKERNIPSVTLQHGLYVDYTDMHNINVANYSSHVADHFLAWGDEVADLIVKYHPHAQATIVGKPLEPVLQRSRADYFTLVFDQNIFHGYNKKLLAIGYELAKTLRLKINLRLHPHNKIDWYDIDISLIVQEQPLNDSAFVLGHTTSMLYELMRLGIPAYKLKSKIPANTIDEQFVFTSVGELLEKIRHHQGTDFDFSAYAQRYVRFIGHEALARYANFITELEQKHKSSSDTPELLK